MKTGRADYIMDIAGIPEDEPVFVIRGQDCCAVSTLFHYARQAENAGAAPRLVKAVREHAEAMVSYQNRTGIRKVPDL